jgi:hypothetical protein
MNPNMLPQVKIAELLLEWANQAGYSKGIKFELGCDPPGTAPLPDLGERWEIKPSDFEPITVCRCVGSHRTYTEVPSPFSSSWELPAWTEEQRAIFVSNISAAIDSLRNSAD